MRVGVLTSLNKGSETKEVDEDLDEMAVLISESLKKKNHDSLLIKADDNIFHNIKDSKINFIFNVCEKFNDDPVFEPHVAALLETAGIPFTGSDGHTLFICNNKIRSKQILANYDIPTPGFQVFNSHEEKLNPDLKFPLIVKPEQQENSIGITEESIVNDEVSLSKQVKNVNEKFKQAAIVEEFVKGDDIEVSMIGNKDDLFFLPIAKVEYGKLDKKSENKIFCYQSKWDLKSRNYGDYIKADLPKDMEEELEKISKKVFNIFKIKDYGRIDFRLSKENKPYVIEVTANPGMSKICSTPESAEWIGISYEELIDKILNASLKRYGLNASNS